MLIDHTYFIGHLNIPHTGNIADIERINTFIEWHEEEFMVKLLGRDLFTEFSAGLMDNPIESKWSNLLGKIVEGLGVVTSADVLSSVGVTVGRGLTYDPVSGGTSVTIPPAYVGKRLVVDQRGFGVLEEGLDYSITGDVLTLLAGHVFSLGDRYYYSTPDVSITQPTGYVKRSMIANYVYYWWMQNEATQTGSVGEVVTKTENAARTSPEEKMVWAWNDMVNKTTMLRVWLDSNIATYPTWKGSNYLWPYHYNDAELFCKINIFGI